MATAAREGSEKLDPSVYKICFVAVFGPLLAQVDATIVNVSLSSLAVELHASLLTIQWVTSAYLLALTLVLPLNGWLLERTGAKRLFLICLAGFTISSALCGLAWSAGSLIAFRAFQGISGGLMAPMAQMLVARAAGKNMSRVVGYMSLPVLFAPILGPMLAGVILQYATWRWLFLVNVPVGLLALLLAFTLLPEDRENLRPRGLDWGGLALLSPSLVLILLGTQGIAGAGGRLEVMFALALIALFLWHARDKGDAALVDLKLFKDRVFRASAITQFLSNGALFAGQMLVPVFLIGACGQAPTDMGWMLAPLGLGMMVSSLAMGVLTQRLGTRRLVCGGTALATLSTLCFVWLAWQQGGGSGLDLHLLLPALFLRGMGQGSVGLPTMSAAYSAVEKHDLPMATTSLNIVQRIGGPTMTTLCATLLAWRLEADGALHVGLNAYGWAFAALALLHGLIWLTAARLPVRTAR
ncbi:MAG: DHA2 family efflux MFS transporter permease subunit [Sphingomonadales bacterium]|nr:DHA2 family efflux MFS transporter permease subunit [Sphingomonadales bacterium]MDE2170719.1 DHA2 family efflux MFS transporter permease subunit [Sphingomonadales bacterium]